MTEKKAIYCLKVMSELEPEVCEECSLYGQVGADHCYEDAIRVAIKALEAQNKLKEYIERINQPEYNGVVWQKDEVVLLLQELVAK